MASDQDQAVFVAAVADIGRCNSVAVQEMAGNLILVGNLPSFVEVVGAYLGDLVKLFYKTIKKLNVMGLEYALTGNRPNVLHYDICSYQI